MLFEFAVTPDVFHRSILNENPNLEVILPEFLKGLYRNGGLIANLNQDDWVRAVQENCETLPQNLKADIFRCLCALHSRHRIVRHPKLSIGNPTTEPEWLSVAMESHNRNRFHGIVVSQSALANRGFKDPHIIEFSKLFKSSQWSDLVGGGSLTVTRCMSDFRKILFPLLRYAKAVTLIDPYMSPHQARFLSTVKMCAGLLGQRRNDRICPLTSQTVKKNAHSCEVASGRIHIHAGNPQHSDKRKERESVKDRLDAWENKLRALIDSKHRHRFGIFLWDRPVDPKAMRLHDRWILTDQCGVSIPRGLDCYPSSNDKTTWSLLREKDRLIWLADYDPWFGSYPLLDKREVLP